MSIALQHVSKWFGAHRVLDDISLEVASGELLGLLGPSGSGKTTLLRIIAGLEPPDAGSLHLSGVEATRQSAADRRVGFVFQHYALFKHLTVFENVAFGLRVRPRRVRPADAEIRQRVGALLEMVQLGPLSDRYPSQLSGGQRQRVALARALAVEPRLLLLDEPFGALDARVRKDLRLWLRRLHDELKVTTIFVTHDQEEALELSDRVVIMHEGRVEQTGTPEEVYHDPRTPFVCRFLGDVNLFHGRVEDGRASIAASQAPGRPETPARDRATLYIRPHRLDLYAEPDGRPAIPALVRQVHRAGPLVRVELTTEWGDPVRVDLSPERAAHLALGPGARVYVSPREDQVLVEHPDAGLSLAQLRH